MNLTPQNYYSKKANLEYMSVSQFKSFAKCQHSTLAEIMGKYEREKTTPLLVGSYVDSYFEGTLETFKEQNPEIFKRDGSLKSDYIQAETIIERIKKDKQFMRHMSGEKQVIMSGYIKGVPIKIKIDSFRSIEIVDLKIVKDFEPIYVQDRGLCPWFEAWDYDIQGAVYQEIVRQNTGKKLPFILAAATKEKVTDIDNIRLNQETLDIALERFERDVELYDAIKKGIITPERCEHCDYCKETKKLGKPRGSEEFELL